MTPESATGDLLARFHGGDRSAYGQLFSRYRAPLLSYFRNRCDSALLLHVSVEDLLQETHAEALRSLARFTYLREKSFFFWLCKIGSRRISYHYRRLHRRPPPLQQAAGSGRSGASSCDILAEIGAPELDPEAQMLASEHLALLAVALDSLRDDYREAIVLRRIEEIDNRTAAAQVGISANAMSIRLSRGVEKLAQSLQVLLGEAVD